MTLRPVQIKHLKNLFQIGNDDQITHAIEKIHPSDLSLLFSELNELKTPSGLLAHGAKGRKHSKRNPRVHVARYIRTHF